MSRTLLFLMFFTLAVVFFLAAYSYGQPKLHVEQLVYQKCVDGVCEKVVKPVARIEYDEGAGMLFAGLGVIALTAASHYARQIKATVITVMCWAYTAGTYLLTMTREDFRIAAPILLPLATLLIILGTILYAMTRLE